MSCNRALLCALGVLVSLTHALAEFVQDEKYETVSWRSIGPSRGGRAAAVAGIPGDPLTYYMGATGGGVWKTTNAGATWRNVTDDFLGTGSVGALAVAPSDSNVVYVGMGEPDVRGNFSHGDGVYKSVDAGKTWNHIGLGDSRQIGRIAVHPNNADLVYVAALGHVFGPNAQRGLYRSSDGGETWERILYVSDRAGAIDVRLDPFNPRVVYAAMWQVSRTPWSLSSGGEDCGLYKSTDGGDTWEELTNGLPDGIKGKINVAPSAARRNRVWAIVEADDGGVFRSDDAGQSWTRTNDDRALRQRAWYYTHIYADTQHADTVYVLNVRFHKSTDGGRTFSTIRVPHGDNHDLWIAPENNQRIVNSNDGGANVSFDGGQTWSRQDNQPTSQFYHVITDNSFPYRVLGAQQDNSTVSISSQNRPGRDDFHPVGGGESGYIAPRPDDPDIVFAGSYAGYLTRYDHRLGTTRTVTVWPDNPIGGGADRLKYRFQWTFPIVISPHDPDVVYVGGNMLFRSEDGGGSWEIISDDLTTDDKAKQRSSGGPITQDNTTVEYYCTIFSVAESPLEQGLIWVGTDDGLVHITEDAGDTWTEITPPDMGDWPLISLVEASPHDADTAYLAVNRYKMDDFRPYVYKTTDRGQSWDLIVDGIDDGAFVRAVREDPKHPGLLYAGTETGVYISYDAGEHWESLQLNLPIVPITDLVVKDDDLVVSTQGRSFWILDDITPLRQFDSGAAPQGVALFEPAVAYRQRWDSLRLHYHLPEDVELPIAIEIFDPDGGVTERFSSEKDEDAEPGTANPTISADAGMNAFNWNMRLRGPVRVPGAVGWPDTPPGPRVPPGRYTARLIVGEVHLEQPFEILPDPRLDTTPQEYRAQFDLLVEIRDTLTRAHRAVNSIRSITSQIDALVARAEKAELGEDIAETADAIKASLAKIEEQIIQTRSKSPQDPLNFPVMINDRIGAIANGVDGNYPPTAQSRQVFEYLSELLDEQLEALDAILDTEIPTFNQMVRELEIPAVILDRID
ncbi:MAG: glycosyl hydrolase [Planctomycetes bacterium]|nr:glycosyl hydrolase [Planctomycetota bacterium]